MTTRQLTGVLLIITTVAVIAYDVAIYFVAGGDATISDIVLEYSWRHPVLPFAIGVLCGHLLWPQYVKVKDNGT